MDETHFRLNEARKRTIVAEGECPFVQVTQNSQYASRYDMITFISGKEVFPPIIYSPQDRKRLGVKGITSEMLNNFIADFLARAIAGTDRYPLFLLCDQAKIHNVQAMRESFEIGLCFEIVDISKLPPESAKRLSPLDNGLLHDWKQRCRRHYPITKNNIKQIMSDEFNNITTKQLKSYYNACGLTSARDTYFDCPAPATHQHKRDK